MSTQFKEKVEGASLSTSETISAGAEDQGVQRQVMYRLLASLFLYPDHERLITLQMVARGMLSKPIVEREHPSYTALHALCERLDELDLKADRRAIINEYNRLFLVRPKAPPHETFYTDTEGQFRGLLTSQLEEEYNQAGLGISSALNELPDHIAVELEFLSFLCGQELFQRKSGNALESGPSVERQGAFMREHLARWFPRMARRVKQAQPKQLYHLVMQVAYTFLLFELDYLGIPH